ncbi:hypothetical protein R6Q59_019849 [Mikania micrantha]
MPSKFTFTSIEIRRLLSQPICQNNLLLLNNKLPLKDKHVAEQPSTELRDDEQSSIELPAARGVHKPTEPSKPDRTEDNWLVWMVLELDGAVYSLSILKTEWFGVVYDEPTVELAATEQSADPRRRHGPNINQRVARSLQNFPEGTKIPLTMNKETKNFVGTSTTHFATECGIVIHNVCPMNFTLGIRYRVM